MRLKFLIQKIIEETSQDRGEIEKVLEKYKVFKLLMKKVNFDLKLRAFKFFHQILT